jgi:hypothetical protein
METDSSVSAYRLLKLNGAKEDPLNGEYRKD